jgi:class 3 adenylate cyclase
MPAMTETVADPILVARSALERHDWAASFEQYTTADATGGLSGADLEGFAQAAFFLARADLELELKERAFKAYETAGETEQAAHMALEIAREYGYAGKPSIASVWARRGERLIGPDTDSYVRGYLALVKSEAARSSGDMEQALVLADAAIDISEHATNADLKAYALSNLGELKILSGDTTDGMALMEEASMAAVNGELTPFTTGVTACRMISACRDLTDYRRASEWIEATEKYCTRQSLTGFPGICRVHRAEVAAVGGSWDQAEQELERATVELEAYRATPPQADGYYAIGDIRRLRGDFEGAEAALREAHARGRTPQPALALIRLAEGKTKVAVSAIAAALTEQTHDRWARTRLLPAQVEIAIAVGDTILARAAADELAAIVTSYRSPALEATRRVTLGRVLLAEGDPAAAAAELRDAIKGWRDVGSPYEVARARMVLARALRSLDDDDDADLELRAATDEFTRLGARVDLDMLERESRERAERRSGPSTVRRTFMFTDIVGSTQLAEALGDDAWERLLRWHDEMVASVVARHRGEIVKSTGDGVFAAFDSARAAVDAAVAIQRALVDHRDTSGFALSVRIGLHSADASARGGDYSGKGVHVAARVAAQAKGGEVLATADTIAEAGDVVTTADPTPTALKGVTEPVSVAPVSWS